MNHRKVDPLHTVISPRERVLAVAFIVGCFCLYSAWSLIIPYDAAPDEKMRYTLVRYISENLSIPIGTDASVRDPIWGTSYVFEPILAPLVSALLRSMAAWFTNDQSVLLHAARFGSVLFGTGTVALCVLISRRLFSGAWRWLFVVFIALLPQFSFLSSYLNSDSVGLFSTALLTYAWLRGLRDGWGRTNAVLLGVGVSVCLLSYFTAYGFILLSMVVYFADRIHGWKRSTASERKGYHRQTIIQVSTILVVVLALAGWWFIRNAYLYHGDFLGLATSGQQSDLYATAAVKATVSSAHGQGWTLVGMLFSRGWIVMTALSSIGVFGYLVVMLPPLIYVFYLAIIGIGFILAIIAIANRFAKKSKQNTTSTALASQYPDRDILPGITLWRKRLFETALMISIPIPVVLSIYHSYTQDYQPQGRYTLPMLLGVTYFITLGLWWITGRGKPKKALKLAIPIAIIIWCAIAMCWSLARIVGLYSAS